MARKTFRTVSFRRKREGKTDYKKRLTYLKSKKPRAVVRKSLKNITVQIVDYMPDGDMTKVMVSSRALDKLGWKYSKSNIPAAYLTGLMIAKKAAEKKIKEVIIDFGMQNTMHGTKLFAVVKGMVDGGLDVPHKESAFPSDERISGAHIAAYAGSSDKPKSQFTKTDASKIADDFEKVKAKIMGQ